MNKKPLHQRFPPLGWLRRHLREALFRFVGKMAKTDEGKAIAARTLRGLLFARSTWEPDERIPEPPYPDLGQATSDAQTCTRSDIIIITARFRSGSTLLWNLFRQMKGFTSYYEPFNERRWFLPSARDFGIDPTHKNAEEYWREYEGLGVLADYYHETWNVRQLYRDADFWDPAMKRYCEILIDRAPGRPVLQFNRIDFRLPWFRRTFPNAKLIHLYRHPRDQWCSSLLDLNCFPSTGETSHFAPHDKFYLLHWCRDLCHLFPFLDERDAKHPYQLFYYLWKLSYLFGRRYAHHSLAFEHLLADPDKELTSLFRVLAIDAPPLDDLKKIMVKPALGKWKEYASEEWFRRHESECENVLAKFFPAPV